MEINSELHSPAALPSVKNPGTLATGGWMGHTASLNVLRKSLLPQVVDCIALKELGNVKTNVWARRHGPWVIQSTILLMRDR